ncbi:McrB family protein [Segatella salivae]|uniref:McrB family protein n=1 Tax=Segatella salivae TaxID=228604 RepID=UPI0021512C55|nr:AAA family ATPase [Segatella salivae]
MKNIQIIEKPKGISSSDIGISVDEWQEILTNPQITTENYREALLAFYREPEHKATCSALSLKYFGNAKDAQRYNAWITKFGESVVKTLDRFHVFDTKGKEVYWNVAMNPSVDLGGGRYEWTLRSELVQAIEKLGWNQNFSWIPFYMEMADKLLAFKNNRKALVDIMYSLDSQYVSYIHTNDGGRYPDIDPFTFFGIFNRGNSFEKRKKIAAFFKERLGVKAEVPENYEGIPIVFAVMSCFCWSENIDTNIQPLWNLFEAVLKKEQEKIENLFDIVCKQKGIKWNITMGLFWIRPYEYIALDSCNQSYLQSKGLNVFSEKNLNAAHYFAFLNEIKQKMRANELQETTIPAISYHAWQSNKNNNKVVETQNMNDFSESKEMKTSKYQAYIDLLKQTHNLVFTGAPGTGKTHMAREIAKEMGAESMFVQFHPSYDYTDFVEGLRPIDNGEGHIVFERKDGVFKEFCRKAVQNLIDSSKSVEELSDETHWKMLLEEFVNDAIDNATTFKTVNGSEFVITGMTESYVSILNEQNAKASILNVSIHEILTLLFNEITLEYVRDIRKYFGRMFGTQADSYTFVIVKKIREKHQSASANKVNQKHSSRIQERDYVFIIDEINRGEASKIFGELFYAIDPGYRDDKDNPVQTQYQNLIPASDVFAKGFYVPRNVYILATMNDIDRSVESMDFAMRRRFTWKEIKPECTEDMLDNLGQSLADSAKETMHRLNNEIVATDGLGAAYSVGPAYFMKIKDLKGDFSALWNMNIEPLLREYLRGFRAIDDMIEKFRKAFFREI